MFHFAPIAFCLLCLTPTAGVVAEPARVVPPALTAFGTWIGFDAPWEAPNVHTPRRYHQAHIPAQRV